MTWFSYKFAQYSFSNLSNFSDFFFRNLFCNLKHSILLSWKAFQNISRKYIFVLRGACLFNISMLIPKNLWKLSWLLTNTWLATFLFRFFQNLSLEKFITINSVLQFPSIAVRVISWKSGRPVSVTKNLNLNLKTSRCVS